RLCFVGVSGLEPLNPKERIYSPPQLPLCDTPILSPLPGSNQRPTDYKSVALPAELRRQDVKTRPIQPGFQRTLFVWVCKDIQSWTISKKKLKYLITLQDMNEKEISSLIRLLDDPDTEVFAHVEEKLATLGPAVVTLLENRWEQSFDALEQNRIENLIYKIQFRQVEENLEQWIKGGYSD